MKLDPGRWLLERQRCALPPSARPRPPERLVSIGALIPSLIERIQKTTHLHVEQVCELWPGVAGPSISKHARPGGLERGVMTVYVDHSLWLSEIQRYQAEPLLRRLQAAYPQGGIRSLMFRLEPDRPPAP